MLETLGIILLPIGLMISETPIWRALDGVNDWYYYLYISYTKEFLEACDFRSSVELRFSKALE